VAVAKPEAAPSFDKYRPLLERNPFTPRLPAKPAPPARVGPVLPPATAKPAEPAKPVTPAPPVTPSFPPGPPDPLKDTIYSGTVMIGNAVYAVLEDKTTHRGQYVKEGDTFQGGSLLRITQGTLLLKFGEETRSLHKSTAFNATPLNAPPAAAGGGSGSGPGGVPNGGGPGGGPGGAPGGPGGPGGRSRGGSPSPSPPGAPVGKITTLSAPAAAMIIEKSSVATPAMAPAPAK
jgi:hypothetical protein